MEMHAPPADLPPTADPSVEAEPLLSRAALDQMAERAAWAVALAAWLHTPDDGMAPLPAPEPPAIDAAIPPGWYDVPPPPSSDWWL